MGKKTKEEDLLAAVEISGVNASSYSGHFSSSSGDGESPQTKTANKKIAEALKVVKKKKKEEGKKKAKQDKEDGYKKGGCKDHDKLRKKGLRECGVCGHEL
jgi:hypothetical protein